jgi:CheY-like chemotaxis protein
VHQLDVVNRTDAPRRVLVVEDDQDIRESVVEILEENGYSPIAASNGREALEMLGRSESLPCVILLDLMMPVMDGRAFREEQLKRPKLSSIPVIVVSAFADMQSLTRGLRFSEALKKPFRMDGLLDVTRRWCCSHRAE